MFPRSLRTELDYFFYRRTRPPGCAYCAAYQEGSGQGLAQGGTMLLMTARFPYARWDGWRVAEHLLVIPVRHTESFASFDDSETRDFMDVVKGYEADGYSFYIRSHANRTRTMPHVHGHLIRAKQ